MTAARHLDTSAGALSGGMGLLVRVLSASCPQSLRHKIHIQSPEVNLKQSLDTVTFLISFLSLKLFVFVIIKVRGEQTFSGMARE